MSRKTREKIRAALEGVTERDHVRAKERQTHLRESISRQQAGTAKRYDVGRFYGTRR